jgi:hypothetical protein
LTIFLRRIGHKNKMRTSGAQSQEETRALAKLDRPGWREAAFSHGNGSKVRGLILRRNTLRDAEVPK